MTEFSCVCKKCEKLFKSNYFGRKFCPQCKKQVVNFENLTQTKKEEIIQMYQKIPPIAVTTICEQYKISSALFYKILFEFNIKRRIGSSLKTHQMTVMNAYQKIISLPDITAILLDVPPRPDILVIDWKNKKIISIEVETRLAGTYKKIEDYLGDKKYNLPKTQVINSLLIINPEKTVKVELKNREITEIRDESLNTRGISNQKYYFKDKILERYQLIERPLHNINSLEKLLFLQEEKNNDFNFDCLDDHACVEETCKEISEIKEEKLEDEIKKRLEFERNLIEKQTRKHSRHNKKMVHITQTICGACSLFDNCPRSPRLKLGFVYPSLTRKCGYFQIKPEKSHMVS